MDLRVVLLLAILASAPKPAAGAEIIQATGVNASSRAAPTAGRVRYALWELVPLGLDEATAAAMLDMLRGELEKIVGDRLVLSARAVEEDVRRAVDQCDDRVACLVEATAAFGADRAIYGVVTNLGDHYNMSLKLLDTVQRQVIAREAATLSGDRNQLLAQIQILLFKIIAPNRLLGQLALSINLDGADVYIDGSRVGTTPLGELAPMVEGQHTLKVTAPFMEDYFTFFEVHHNKTTQVSVDATRLKQVAGELVAFTRVLDPVIIGVKGGYGTNFGSLQAPAVALELGAALRPVSRHLYFGVEVGGAWSETTDQSALDERVTTKVWSVPVLAWVGVEAGGERFGAYGRAGAGGALVERRLRSPSTGRELTRAVEPVFHAAAGARLRLGPGALILEVPYEHTLASDAAVDGSAGGLRALLGYRLEL